MSWFNFRARSKEPEYLPQLGPSGLYLWGDVGCGKTMLMDMLYETLPSTTHKTRVHFHAFMLDMHKYGSLLSWFQLSLFCLFLLVSSPPLLFTMSLSPHSLPLSLPLWPSLLLPPPFRYVLETPPDFLHSILIPDNPTLK